ncbi:hypothetical protein R3P38DRAFT_2883683 [Favolaschia claudopus]|uniref:Uncharacterized protein n=1 Tax=Favolaschia claudopus TaxID=2862362 RepID=A0AAW0CX86_9AGAR
MLSAGIAIVFLLLSSTCNGVDADSHPQLSAVSPRVDNVSSSLTATFTFTVPRDSHDDGFSDWIGVVCLHPEEASQAECEMPGFMRCPNPDVSGILVRVPAYLASLLLGIIIIYHPEEAAQGVWTQLLTVYSLLISAIIAVYTKGLTRFHSGMTVFLVLSPLSLTLLVYTLLGFIGRPHRLDSILSSERKHLLPRLLVILFWLIALFLLLFTSIANEKHFTPALPCDDLPDKGHAAATVYSLISVPYVGTLFVILVTFAVYSAGDARSIAIIIGTVTPFLLLLIAAVYAAVRSRGDLTGEIAKANISGMRNKFWAYWALFGQRFRYPFLHLYGVFLVPMIYWVIFNEARLAGTADNIFAVSFGQVLATFVVLDPLWQVIKMSPGAVGWFRDLTITRWATGGPKHGPTRLLNTQPDHEEMVSLNRWNK